MANPLRDLKNGMGFVYITEPDGTTIVGTYLNIPTEVTKVQLDATTRAPLASETSARTLIILAGAAGTITSILINGVEVLGSTASGGTLALIAADAADIINSYTSSPEYYAYSNGDNLIIYAAAGAGSTPNGYTVAVTVAGGLTETDTPMSGGTNVQGIYDAAYGHRYFLNADYDSDGCCGTTPAVEGDLTNSIEITKYLIMQGLQGHIDGQALTIAGGVLTVERNEVITVISVETQGGAGTDTLNSISTEGFNDGDILILRGVDPSHVVTFTDYVSGNDNLILANGLDFDSGDYSNCIALQFFNITGTGARWYEIFRTPQIALTVINIRNSGIPQPVSGVEVTALPTSGTINIEAGVDKGIQVYNGTVALIGSVVIQPQAAPATPYLDGDEIYIDYRALATVGANSVTIFGIALTDTQALEGRIVVMSKYSLGDTTWYSKLFYSPNGIDLVDTVALATKEPGLGNPAADGYLLSSTTLGVRSWVPPSLTDTGWVDLDGFTYLPFGSRPQYRVIGKQLSFRGNVVVPLATDGTGATLVPYVNEASYVAATAKVTPYQGSAATGGVLVNSAGSITLNQNVAVIPTDYFPDNTYTTGWIIAARRVDSNVAGNEIGYTAAIVLYITTAGKLAFSTVRDFEELTVAGALGSSPFRFSTSNATTGDYAMDFRVNDPAAGADTIYGITANTPNTLIIKQQVMKHQITIDAAEAGNLGGFQFPLDGLKAYLAA